ncbi:MAG: hypothetical protein ACUZ8I_10385 [Candidatus Scalindua sp.]
MGETTQNNPNVVDASAKPMDSKAISELHMRILKKVERERTSKRTQSRHRRWIRNLRARLGDQWNLEAEAGTYYGASLRGGRRKQRDGAEPVINVIRREMRIVRGLALSHRGEPVVVRESNEDTDKRGAIYSNKWLDHRRVIDDDEFKFVQTLNWGMTTGMGIRKNMHNPRAGKRIFKDLTTTVTETQPVPVSRCPNCKRSFDGDQSPCPECGNRTFPGTDMRPTQVEKVTGREESFTGDNVTESVPPFCITVDGNATSIIDPMWIDENRLRTTSWIFDFFGKKVDPDKIDKKDFEFERSLFALDGGGDSSSFNQGDDDHLLYARVHEYRELPTMKFPNGIFMVYTEKEVIHFNEDEGLPYYSDLTHLIQKGELSKDRNPRDIVKKTHSYDFIPYEPVENSFWAQSLVDDILDAQMIKNAFYNQMTKWMKWIASVKIMNPTGSGLKPQYISNELQEIRYKPKVTGNTFAKPEFLTTPNLPADMWNFNALIDQDIEQQVGTEKIIRGQPPSGGLTGVALAELRENAQITFIPMLLIIDRAEVIHQRWKLVLAQQFMTEEEQIKVGGRNSVWEVEAFRGIDIAGNYDVRIEMSAVRLSSRAYKDQKLVDLIDRFPERFQDPKIIDKVFENAGMSEYKVELSVDIDEARHENDLIRKGERVIPGRYDNHGIHYEEHRIETKMPWFYELPDNHPLKLNMYQHIDFHYQQMQIARQEQMQQRAIAMGLGQNPNDALANPANPGNGIQQGSQQEVPAGI